MKRLICKNIRKCDNRTFTDITLNKSYLGVVKNGTFKTINDTGSSAVYPISLFREPKRIVKAAPHSLKEIKITTRGDEYYDDPDCTVSFNGRQTNMYIDGTSISCGIIYINNLNELKHLIQDSISPVINIPLEDIFSYIISEVMKEVRKIYSYGFCLLSTNTNQKNFYILSWLDKNCVWYTDTLNPNSGNTIRLWVLT